MLSNVVLPGFLARFVCSTAAALALKLGFAIIAFCPQTKDRRRPEI